MNEPEINRSLSQIQLFELFRAQLNKDFESSGCESEFTVNLPKEFPLLRDIIVSNLNKINRTNSSLLPILLYRVDVSEKQIKDYGLRHQELSLEEVMAELIIKRILQKIIIKKTFSGK